MRVLLFKLKNVPEDEADDIRQLLNDNEILFYETPPGRWGISLHAIWLPDDSRHEEARSLIDNYEKQRYSRVRGEYEKLKKSGLAETFLHRLSTYPLQTILYIAVILLILYLTTMPFIHFGSD